MPVPVRRSTGDMYKRILLSLDGSALAEQALPHAVAQAERFGAELILRLHNGLLFVVPVTRVLGLEKKVGRNAEKGGTGRAGPSGLKRNAHRPRHR